MTIQAQQKFEAELIEALEQHFGEGSVQVHEKPIALKDWMGHPTANKAHLVVPKNVQEKKAGHALAVTELGYERNKSGTYECHYDPDGFSAEHANLIAQYYAEKVTAKQMKKQGFSVARKQLEDGRIQLTCQRYA